MQFEENRPFNTRRERNRFIEKMLFGLGFCETIEQVDEWEVEQCFNKAIISKDDEFIEEGVSGMKGIPAIQHAVDVKREQLKQKEYENDFTR